MYRYTSIDMYTTVYISYNIVSCALALAIPPDPGETTTMVVSTRCVHMIYLIYTVFMYIYIYRQKVTNIHIHMYIYIYRYVYFSVNYILYSIMRLCFGHSSRSWRNNHNGCLNSMYTYDISDDPNINVNINIYIYLCIQKLMHIQKHIHIQIHMYRYISIDMYITVYISYNIVSCALALAIPPGPGETTTMVVSIRCIHMIYLICTIFMYIYI